MAICKFCNITFIPKHIDTMFCSKSCVNKHHYMKNKNSYKKRAKTWQRKNKESHKLSVYKWLDKTGKRAEYSASYRAGKFKATPEWANKKEISKIYRLAKNRGLVVDHIVPINSPNVCGLHCEDNLRCITTQLNSHKANYYWPDM